MKALAWGVAIGALIAVVLLLAGCGSDPEPDAVARLTIAGKPYECTTTIAGDLGSEMTCRTLEP
jgi:hypothetical protein